MVESDSVYIENVIVKNNSSRNSGGIVLYDNSFAELKNVSILNNHGEGVGGGIVIGGNA